jgi:hypothetical protein
MTPEQSYDLDAVLDRFEIRLRRKWSFAEARIEAAHRKRLRDQLILDEPSFRAGVVKPSLDHYDNLQPRKAKRGHA